MGHGLVALSNGSVLAVGGFDGSDYLQSAEIYMPVEKIWVAVGKDLDTGMPCPSRSNPARLPEHTSHCRVPSTQSLALAPSVFSCVLAWCLVLGLTHSRDCDALSPPMYTPHADSMWVKRAGCRATLGSSDDRVMVVGASSTSFDRSVELYQGGRYRCYAEDGKTGCHPVANTDPGGVDIDTCRAVCGPSPPAPPTPTPRHFRCIANKCVEIPGLDGTTKPDCEKICGADTGAWRTSTTCIGTRRPPPWTT